MEKAHQVLKNIFAFDSFRLAQEAAIKRLIVDNANSLVVFPTGGGKSLVYQVPALCLDGLTLVISPLIALMKDQVDALVAKGVRAANLDSTLTADRAAWVKEEVLSGNMKVLYVAPERLNNEGFINMMSRVTISLLAVDEAHCISQWGASFRPEYLKIARFAKEQNVERVLCLTATATLAITKDICESFSISSESGIFRTPVYRPNLSLQVKAANSLDDKLTSLIPLLKSRTGPSIVYVTTQKHTDEIRDHLLPHGIYAMVYHAGMPGEQRAQVQTAFMESDAGIVICTIAFGMGIDKANIRQVIHLYMPKTLENYSQEVGRAGRDGLPSTCVMYLSAPDIPVLEGFARGDTCSKRDLELWLQEVVMKNPSADGTLDFNHYQQAKEYDMRSNVLGLLFAELELDYGYIRAITPFYATYDIAPVGNTISSDNSKVAKAIRMYWHAKGTGKYELDVVDAATRSGIDRQDIARCINNWELDGAATIKASQVRARYAIIKPFEKTTEALKRLADELHRKMINREEEAVRKLREVIKVTTDDDCIAYALASYFGDEDAVPDGMCKNCTFCMTGQSIEFKDYSAATLDSAQLNAVLQACWVRDDPRLLTRMAFGITSPRLTANKWSSSHPLFGCMGSVDFNVLLDAFDEECAKVSYESLEPPAPIVAATKKRTYSSYSNNRGDSKKTRGSSSKRSRRY